MSFALSALPETFINTLQVCFLRYSFNLYVFSSFVQSFVSLRRIEKYLNSAEVVTVPPLDQQFKTIAFQSCTLTWPQDRNASSMAPSAASTPKHKFVLVDLSLNFPHGELSLVCGKLGSGKTLLLLGKPFSLFRSLHSNSGFI
jgi:ABC-type multidrug transport system fused ATPase/permease subunit